MAFWSKLFGSGASEPIDDAPASGAEELYKGFTIRAKLMPNGREFQLAGSIEKDSDGSTARHEFVRADRFSTREEAQNFTFVKGRQIIDEQGDALFNQSWPAPSR